MKPTHRVSLYDTTRSINFTGITLLRIHQLTNTWQRALNWSIFSGNGASLGRILEEHWNPCAAFWWSHGWKPNPPTHQSISYKPTPTFQPPPNKGLFTPYLIDWTFDEGFFLFSDGGNIWWLWWTLFGDDLEMPELVSMWAGTPYSKNTCVLHNIAYVAVYL